MGVLFSGLHGRVQGSAHPSFPAESALFPAESALFVEECNFQCLSPVARNTSKGIRSLHKTNIFPRKGQNQKFSPEKKCFFCNYRTWNLIPRC
jgi:hypothetical protein